MQLTTFSHEEKEKSPPLVPVQSGERDLDSFSAPLVTLCSEDRGVVLKHGFPSSYYNQNEGSARNGLHQQIRHVTVTSHDSSDERSRYKTTHRSDTAILKTY